VCVSLSGVLFSVGVCVCDLLICLHDIATTNIERHAFMYCNKGLSRENTILRNRVGDEGGGGVPKQGGCLRMIVLILIERLKTKRISCKGLKALSFHRAEPCAVESRFGPKRGFGVSPGDLLIISKPNPYSKSEKPPARKGFTKPNL